MLKKSEIIGFVATQNAAAARKFYQKTLGLKLVYEDPFAIVFDANGTMLRLSKVPRLTPAPFTVLGWKVRDVAAVIRDLARKGVRFLRFEGLDQDKAGIWSSPSGAKVAWFKDPDGNMLSLTEFP
jgi:catechol 2,3-dioxygenase-like lactoylglutathione lyase family enzyme